MRREERVVRITACRREYRVVHSAVVRCGVHLMFLMVILKAVAQGKFHGDACRDRQLCKFFLQGGVCVTKGRVYISEMADKRDCREYVCRSFH